MSSCDYRLFLPAQAVGANLVYFDLFNESKQKIKINHVHPIVSGDVAVVGTLGIDLYLTFTTAIGTGGTAATRSGTALDAATFVKHNPIGDEVPLTITARITPTGGATAGGVITWCSLFTEETAAATYMGQMTQIITDDDHIIIPENYGIRVVQGAVASVGNIGFDIGFNIID